MEKNDDVSKSTEILNGGSRLTISFSSQGINTLFIVLLIGFLAFYFIDKARKGEFPKMRHIAGLDVISEAIGRATELGRPVHFSPGIGGITNDAAPQTFAALSLLGYVANLTAKYDTALIVTIRAGVVYPLADETVRISYVNAGKAESYNQNMVQFISDQQFAYAAGVMGIFARERIAANIMMGAFWAESLLFAEAGSQAGAIQVAGTANMTEIPNFIVGCDYTLIGEELYAGGAYLSQNPVQLGSIRAQDIIKLTIVILIPIGVLMATANITFLKTLFTY